MRTDQLSRYIFQQKEIGDLSPSVRSAVYDALMLKGSGTHITTHGAMSQILTTMLDNGMTAQVVPAVSIYSACYPTSLSYLLKSFPAKVSNYLCRHADATTVIEWCRQNPDWSERIISSVTDGTFDTVLYGMRTAVGAMTINQPVLTMLHRLRDEATGIGANALAQAQEILDKAPDTLSQSPRQWSADCNTLRAYILYFLMADLENRYGEMASPQRTYMIPFYAWEREVADQPATGIVSFSKDSGLDADFDYGLCIGWRYDKWEQFFYQACLGAVFLLNPRIAPVGTLKTSALHAGVAIRFAEEMLSKYLPYTGGALVESPVGTGNAYDLAWQAARKLPDNVLSEIRRTFGSFGNVSDLQRFTEMTSRWLTPDEARLLSGDFTWYTSH